MHSNPYIFQKFLPISMNLKTHLNPVCGWIQKTLVVNYTYEHWHKIWKEFKVSPWFHHTWDCHVCLPSSPGNSYTLPCVITSTLLLRFLAVYPRAFTTPLAWVIHRNILQRTKEELGCLSLHYHILSTHLTNHFLLCMQFGWYWLQLIETITDLSITNGSIVFASGCTLTRKEDADSGIVTVNFDSAKTVADLRTKFMPFDADFPIPFPFRATSKELGLHPHADTGWLAMPPEYLRNNRCDSAG